MDIAAECLLTGDGQHLSCRFCVDGRIYLSPGLQRSPFELFGLFCIFGLKGAAEQHFVGTVVINCADIEAVFRGHTALDK